MTDKRKKSATKGKDDNRCKKFTQSSDPIKAEHQRKAIASYYAKKNTSDKMVTTKKETYPHFRYYKKSKHPALIVGEQPIEEYRYRKVMHSEKDGDKKNERVLPNPNPKDKYPMYIGKRVRHDKKFNFEEKKLPWKYLEKNKKK